MALSYNRQSPAGLQAAGRSAGGLGWPEGPLTARVNGVAGTGIGGLGWPEGSDDRKDRKFARVPRAGERRR